MAALPFRSFLTFNIGCPSLRVNWQHSTTFLAALPFGSFSTFNNIIGCPSLRVSIFNIQQNVWLSKIVRKFWLPFPSCFSFQHSIILLAALALGVQFSTFKKLFWLPFLSGLDFQHSTKISAALPFGFQFATFNKSYGCSSFQVSIFNIQQKFELPFPSGFNLQHSENCLVLGQSLEFWITEVGPTTNVCVLACSEFSVTNHTITPLLCNRRTFSSALSFGFQFSTFRNCFGCPSFPVSIFNFQYSANYFSFPFFRVSIFNTHKISSFPSGFVLKYSTNFMAVLPFGIRQNFTFNKIVGYPSLRVSVFNIQQEFWHFFNILKSVVFLGQSKTKIVFCISEVGPGDQCLCARLFGVLCDRSYDHSTTV